MSSPSKRREMDVMKLMMSEFEVETKDEGNMSEFFVKFVGPKDTPYEGGIWRVHVELPLTYPYKSPSIGFVNKMFHPNVDLGSGSVCLDVINQTWSPMFDLVNVFGVFLPQLMAYPNPSDPLNGEAASLLLRNPQAYKTKVQEFITQHATQAQYDRQISGRGVSCGPEDDGSEGSDDASSLGGGSDLDDLMDD